MSYETRAYDTEHGDPVVVLVATGTHDVSRLVQLLHHGNCEQLDVGERVLRQVRRHNGGQAALRLLRDHGGADFTGPVPDGEDVPARLRALADALHAASWWTLADALRAAAQHFHEATPEVRAVVAAALAGGAR